MPTRKIKEFYEENPFPNYDGCRTIDDLVKRMNSEFYHDLDKEIGDKDVLEVGCGTGQLCNYLGRNKNRLVVGVDICENSLKLARIFRDRNNLLVYFLREDLFGFFLSAFIRPKQFDYVICTGVLHHTKDPEKGFRIISKIIKPKGRIVIGLYNKYGRVATNIRKKIFNLTGDRFKFLDSELRKRKGDLWFKDQYKNPYESTHTMGEVLNRFDKYNFRFVRSAPSFLYSRKLTQLRMMIEDKEGGFFIMVGEKNESPTTRQAHFT